MLSSKMACFIPEMGETYLSSFVFFSSAETTLVPVAQTDKTFFQKHLVLLSRCHFTKSFFKKMTVLI